MFRCNRRNSIAIALSFTMLSTGCTTTQFIPWGRPGVADAKLSADYSECQAQVREDTQRNYAIDTDIAATHATDWRNAGIYNMQKDSLNYNTAELSQRLLNSCMFGRGYRPVS